MGVPIGWTDPDFPEAAMSVGWRSGTAHRWPAPRVKDEPSPQYDWEPPRVARGVKDRRQRIAALGDGQVPQVVEMIGLWLKAHMEAMDR